MERLDERVWSAVSKAVSDPNFVYERLVALQAEAPFADIDAETTHIKARIKALSVEERNLVSLLRTAPSASESVSGELEKIASERKGFERKLKAQAEANGHNGTMVVDAEVVKTFCKAVKPFLKAMGVEQKRKLLSLLGFQATAGDEGEVRASIAVPTSEDRITTGRTWA